MVEATQIAQDAQAGYACDYCSKRQPMAFNECKEACKGHRKLAEKIGKEPLNRVGKRHAMRIMSDAYGKGIVRAQVENTNLRAYAKDNDITSAESIKTCMTVSFVGRNYVEVVENLNDKKLAANSTVFAEVDTRSKRHRKITFRDVAAFYGHRPKDPRVWYLSPYDFVTEWEVIMLKYPWSLKGADDDKFHAALTKEGVELLTINKGRSPRLEAGVHYRVKDGLHRTWISFPSGFATDLFRDTWVISKRPRPVAPMFIGSPIPLRHSDSADRSAMLTMAYFRPWTLRKEEAEESVVPFAGCLRGEDLSWQDALAVWLDGEVISEESMRYINNFLSVYRVRPCDPTEDILSDEDFSEEELELTEIDLERALRSKVGGREPKAHGKAKTCHPQGRRHMKKIRARAWRWRSRFGVWQKT